MSKNKVYRLESPWIESVKGAYHRWVPARDDEIGEYEFSSLLAQSCRDEVAATKA
jgi:hypothetical protein